MDVKLIPTILPVAFVVMAMTTTDVTSQTTASFAPSSFPSRPASQRVPREDVARIALDLLPPPPTVTASRTGQDMTTRATHPGIGGPAVFRSQPNSNAPGSWPAIQGASQSMLNDSSRQSNNRLPTPSGGSTGAVVEAAKIIARVGDQVILAGDLLGQVNQYIHNYLDTLPAAQRAQLSKEVLDVQRWRLVRQLLPQLIDTKLVYLDFLRTVPQERVPEIQDNLYQQFDEKQLPVIVERAKVRTAADLDRLLRSFGSSLDQQRRSFAEQLVAAQWKRQHASSTKEVSHEDLLAYYTEHQAEYRLEAKSKWEQLSAYYDEYPSREAARIAVARMGNEVLGGAPLAAVARRSSQGPTAVNGGAYDWTTQGSLRSEVLDRAIFSLPIDRLSQILEDDDGRHIVRVTQRQDAGVVSFVDAQATIKEKITEQRAEAALQEYVAKLRAETRVWTIFDAEPPLSP